MKNRLLLTFLLVGGCLIGAKGQDDFWVEISNPPGGDLKEIYWIENAEMLIGLDYGPTSFNPLAFKSTDDGETWEEIVTPLDSLDFRHISVSPYGSLYGYRINRDVFKSEDFGESWGQVAEDSEYRWWHEITEGNIIAFDSFNDEIVKSIDNGLNWETLLETGNTTITGNPFRIQRDGSIQFRYFNSPTCLTFVSKDEGMSWDTLFLPTHHNRWHPLVVDSSFYLFVDSNGANIPINTSNSVLYLGKVNDPEYKQLVSPDSSNYLIGRHTSPISLNNGELAIIVNDTLFTSDDKGLTWAYKNHQGIGGQAGEWFDFITEQLPNDKIFLKTSGGVMVSDDGGQSFYFGAHGLRNSTVSWNSTNNQNTIWGSNIMGLFKSNNLGEEWEQVFIKGIHSSYRRFDHYEVDENCNVYIVLDGKIHHSENCGASFTEAISSLDDILKIYLGNEEGCFFARQKSFKGIWKTTNFGQDWTLVLPDATLTNFDYHKDGRIYAQVKFESFTESSLIYSDDNGENWSIANQLPPSISSSISSFQLSPSGTIYIRTQDSLYYSDDHCHNMTVVNAPDIYIDAINSQGDIFIEDLGKLYRSNNKGLNWTLMPLPEEVILRRLFMDENDYLFINYSISGYERHFRSTLPTSQGTYLFGNASKSDDEDCSTFDPAFPMENIIIEAKSGDTWYTQTDTLAGDYQMFVDTGSYTVTAIPPLPFFWDTCAFEVDLPIENDTTYQDFSMPALGDCPFITVDLAVPFLERCFEQDIFIQYCNHGTEPADSVQLFLELDDFLSITETEWNWIPVPDTTNLYSLTLPGMEVNDCQTITTAVEVSCDAELGQIHCITVNGSPDLLCHMPPNWSGAEIEASAECQDSVVYLALENVGTAPSSQLDFVIIEDDVVLFQGDTNYQVAEVFEYFAPANGSFLRIESEQEPGHPFPGPVAAWEIGCNGNGTPSFEFIPQFPQGDAFGSEDSNCDNNAGSYDPNDKTGAPFGYGPRHFIKPGTDIEYLIRFQNTGTAPAHDVVIRDTLSSHFLPGSIRVGAASHPFTWNLSGSGVLTFRFDDIELPDSLSNEPESHGFISFKISHRPELPLGTILENSAAIYFDFNAPIITNNSFHELGVDFLEVISNTKNHTSTNNTALSIYPNPASDRAIIQLPESGRGMKTFRIYSSHGQLMREESIPFGNFFVVEKEDLPNGLFFIEIKNEGGDTVGNGKVLFGL